MHGGRRPVVSACMLVKQIPEISKIEIKGEKISFGHSFRGVCQRSFSCCSWDMVRPSEAVSGIAAHLVVGRKQRMISKREG